jgi:hypothetical protein
MFPPDTTRHFVLSGVSIIALRLFRRQVFWVAGANTNNGGKRKGRYCFARTGLLLCNLK